MKPPKPILSAQEAKNSLSTLTRHQYFLLAHKPPGWAEMPVLQPLPIKLIETIRTENISCVRFSDDKYFLQGKDGNYFEINY